MYAASKSTFNHFNVSLTENWFEKDNVRWPTSESFFTFIDLPMKYECMPSEVHAISFLLESTDLDEMTQLFDTYVRLFHEMVFQIRKFGNSAFAPNNLF